MPDAALPSLESGSPFMTQVPQQAVADGGWQDTKPRAWRRYFARALDTAVAGVILFIAGFLFVALDGDSALLDFDNPVVDLLVTAAVSVPYQALLLGSTGTTIGKWMMGVRITHRDGKGIGFPAALRRELHVWSAGMCFGIPLLLLITQARSYRKLKAEGATAWDRDRDWVLTYRPNGLKQVVLATLGVAAAAALFLAFKVLTDS